MSETVDQNSADQHAVDQAAARKAIGALDRQLDKLKRRRAFHMPWGMLKFIVVAAIVGPVLWVLFYRVIPAPTTLLMLERSWEGQRVAHMNVKLSDISPHLVRAVLAGEDARFCRHHGFDMNAIEAAYASNQTATNLARGKVRGGSTISQQTAKNLFLWPQRSLIRKGLETYFTFMTEHLWPKTRIMEAYLNAAEWGDGVFGAQAAAQARFGVSAGQLTPHQAALLAAVLPSPNKWSAVNPGPYVRRRAASIEARMWAIRAQGLDLCVLDAKAAPPPAPRRGTVKPNELPPLPALPPDVAAAVSDAPTITPEENAAPDDPLAKSTLRDGELETPGNPEPPADAPAARPGPAPSSTTAP